MFLVRSDNPLPIIMGIALVKSGSARRASHEPAFMVDYLTIRHTCLPSHVFPSFAFLMFSVFTFQEKWESLHSMLRQDWNCLNLTTYSFANRIIGLNNFWNICKTKFGNLISGGSKKEREVLQKIQKLISRGLLFRTGEYRRSIILIKWIFVLSIVFGIHCCFSWGSDCCKKHSSSLQV